MPQLDGKHYSYDKAGYAAYEAAKKKQQPQPPPQPTGITAPRMDLPKNVPSQGYSGFGKRFTGPRDPVAEELHRERVKTGEKRAKRKLKRAERKAQYKFQNPPQTPGGDASMPRPKKKPRRSDSLRAAIMGSEDYYSTGRGQAVQYP